jgi:putative tryptophan/tyrosine transport system substrate-binding protein
MTRDGTVGRSDATERPAVSLGHRSRLSDEASVRGLHQGQQSFGLREQAGHMTASGTRSYLLPGGGHPHMNRRTFIAVLGGAAAVRPLEVRAQLQPKMLRVGFVGMQPRESPLYANFLKRMAELGYQEGRNFTFDYIQTPNIEGYEGNYRELAARKVDVFLAVGNERALRAALLAAEGRPIAFLAVDFDPLARGYVASLSRPGGNVTGIFVRQLELAAKRVEIAREAFPGATVVGIAYDSVSPEQRDAAVDAARKFGLEPRLIEVKGEQGYAEAFRAMDDARGQPIILPAGPTFLRDRAAIAQALLERRIPSIAAFRENVEAGALISYGFDLMGLFYDIASYVHRIAAGAKLSDMPIEQSPRFYMAVNLKTAASLGLSLSDVFVARANEVRE